MDQESNLGHVHTAQDKFSTDWKFVHLGVQMEPR